MAATRCYCHQVFSYLVFDNLIHHLTMNSYCFSQKCQVAEVHEVLEAVILYRLDFAILSFSFGSCFIVSRSWNFVCCQLAVTSFNYLSEHSSNHPSPASELGTLTTYSAVVMGNFTLKLNNFLQEISASDYKSIIRYCCSTPKCCHF